MGLVRQGLIPTTKAKDHGGPCHTGSSSRRSFRHLSPLEIKARRKTTKKERKEIEFAAPATARRSFVLLIFIIVVVIYPRSVSSGPRKSQSLGFRRRVPTIEADLGPERGFCDWKSRFLCLSVAVTVATDNADWQRPLQLITLGLIFSYLLAKLISILFSFKKDNLSLNRGCGAPRQADVVPDQTEKDSMLAEHGNLRNEKDNEDDGASEGLGSDWEGVESTELDEMFSAAIAFVAAAAAYRVAAARSVGSDVQLKLYGLYKIATEGPCTRPQPSALKMSARAKWQAWHKLGAMPPEDAMQQYIDIITELHPLCNYTELIIVCFLAEIWMRYMLLPEKVEMEKLLRSIESGVSVNVKGTGSCL